MKKSYETPQFEIIKIEEDIIVTSNFQTVKSMEGSEGGVNFGDLFGGNH